MREGQVEIGKISCIGLINVLNTCSESELEALYKTREFGTLIGSVEDVLWKLTFKDIETEWDNGNRDNRT